MKNEDSQSFSRSYRTILKSTALTGTSQVIVILASILRQKVIAVLLGPAGVGMISLYSSPTALVGTITGLGIGNSGVRQIAEAAAANDADRIARTTLTLRRTSLASGILGMALMLALCIPLGKLTFGDTSHTWGMAAMSLALLFQAISAGQMALLQGLRKLGALAASRIVCSVFGTIAGVTIIYFLRERGIVPFLISIALFTLLASWHFARPICRKARSITLRETSHESVALLRMGTAFMVSSLLNASVSYGARLLIRHQLGSESVGLYQATWSFSTLYMTLLLGAMAMDFYPRLTGAAKDHPTLNRLVNEQTEMGMLFALPGVVLTIVFAPLLLTLFYSKAFVPAMEVIRWQSVGVALRVVGWPLSYVLLAKGKGFLFAMTELVQSVVNMALLAVALRLYGLEGAGISYAAVYLLYTAGMYAVCRQQTGFGWSRRSRKLLWVSSVFVTLTFLLVRNAPPEYGIICGSLIGAITAIGSLVGLQKLLKVNMRQLIRQVLIGRRFFTQSGASRERSGRPHAGQ